MKSKFILFEFFYSFKYSQGCSIQLIIFLRFKPLSAKEVIHNVLFDYLSTKEYIKEDAPTWTKEIADIIRDKIKSLFTERVYHLLHVQWLVILTICTLSELEFKKYKYMVNIVLGQKNGAGLKMGTRCIWDAEADCYAHDSFTNVSNI